MLVKSNGRAVMEADMSHYAEDYLEAIYRLQKEKGVAKTTELADALNVVPGSVTNTIQHLRKHGLVKHEPYKGIKLTSKGEKIALGILRRHRLAERLLTDVLNANWSTVHDNACKLEHALSEEVIMLLDRKLGYPKLCPHGNPIPSEEGAIEEEECDLLTSVSVSKLYKVSRIIDERRANLLVLASIGMKPGAEVRVIEKNPSGLVLHVYGKKCTLNYDIASGVCVKSVGDGDCATP